MSDYCRKDVLRIFGIRERQLRLWERNGLIAMAQSYTFQDLGQVRKLRELGARRISAGSIRDAVSAMRIASGLPEPLLEAGLDVKCSARGRAAFRHSGAVVEPIGGQYLLNFSGSGKPAIAAIQGRPMPSHRRDAEAARLFALAVCAEEAGQLDDARRDYEAVLVLVPGHAASAINLGTIFYHRRDYSRAEYFYRMATESNGSYALAFFDLGNVLDEVKRLPEAIAAYRRALVLDVHYADAHYNLALALERSGRRRTALPHWTAYLRLDSRGPWAVHARAQLRKTLGVTGIKLVAGSAVSPGRTRQTRNTPAAEDVAGNQGRPVLRIV